MRTASATKDALVKQLIDSGRIVYCGESGVVRTTANYTSPRVRKSLGHLTKKGYLRTGISLGSKRMAVMVHRIACIAAHGMPPTPRHQVNHKDRCKTNNVSTNIEWATNQQNAQHAVVTGVARSMGERHYKRLLTEDQVNDIRSRQKPVMKTIAKEFGVHTSTVWAILKNRSWKHLVHLALSSDRKAQA